MRRPSAVLKVPSLQSKRTASSLITYQQSDHINVGFAAEPRRAMQAAAAATSSCRAAPAGLVSQLPISLQRRSGHQRQHLVARFSQIEGYKCLSLTRALDVVK